MTRPKTIRTISEIPTVCRFCPEGEKTCSNDQDIILSLDEIEAIRLADLEGLYQEQVAEKMKVSRQTISRILSAAHKKTAEALVEGKAIRLAGGQVKISTQLK